MEPGRRIRSTYAGSVPLIVIGWSSSLPRTLLAHFCAIVRTYREFSPSVFCPVALNSPNQQAQSEVNHANVLRFRFERRPLGAQLVVGLESSRDVSPDVLADAEVIELRAVTLSNPGRSRRRKRSTTGQRTRHDSPRYSSVGIA